MLLDNKKIESYRERIKNGNRYIDGPLVDIHVNYKELSRYGGISFIYKDSHYISYDFGYRNDLDIDKYLTQCGY